MSLEEQNKSDSSSDPLTQDWSKIRLQLACSEVYWSIELKSLSLLSLAYLGDAVYELYVRTCYLLPPKRIADYHSLVVEKVRAESQAACLLSLEPHLTELEREVVRRGRNAVTKHPRRLSRQLYQQATSFEALLGFLYLQDPDRLSQLLNQINVK